EVRRQATPLEAEPAASPTHACFTHDLAVIEPPDITLAGVRAHAPGERGEARRDAPELERATALQLRAHHGERRLRRRAPAEPSPKRRPAAEASVRIVTRGTGQERRLDRLGEDPKHPPPVL